MAEERISAQLAKLRTEWPLVAQEVSVTFYPGVKWAETDGSGKNACGYLLWGLERLRNRVVDLHAHKGYTSAEVDFAAAREIAYQFNRGKRYDNPAAFLAKCLWNLPSERPEKLETARRAVAYQGEKRSTNTPKRATCDGPQPIGEVLKAGGN